MNQHELPNEITVITNATRDMLLEKNPDSLALYFFYIKATNHQESNSVWITDEFAMKGLKWGKQRVVEAKKLLVDSNLVEVKKERTDKGTFGKSYVVVKYLWKQETKETLIKGNSDQEYQNQQYQNPQVVSTRGGFQETNALSNYKLNALSNKKEMLKVETHENILEDLPIGKEKKEKPYSSQNFLLTLDEETITEFEQNFNCSRKEIIKKAQDLFDWCETNGKRKKDHKAFLRQALRKDYGNKEKLLRPEDDLEEFIRQVKLRNELILKEVKERNLPKNEL